MWGVVVWLQKRGFDPPWGCDFLKGARRNGIRGCGLGDDAPPRDTLVSVAVPLLLFLWIVVCGGFPPLWLQSSLLRRSDGVTVLRKSADRNLSGGVGWWRCDPCMLCC
ncbi:uncharacterized protein TM35_000102640 [Trypanosoma theileri]|uniref:Uncharacterized protein n=1 Tax=Trypanosoma theileri TaxID=67003 RepID=A0A1X0NZ58_9TRYP|nr:uncharacterized protein TM35_000102640 [Trypanosoma theileri]ORC89996.1 hypothetical protein TM35_000102640 [Trypanosoma theileri]